MERAQYQMTILLLLLLFIIIQYTLDELSTIITDGGDNFHNIICGDLNGDISRCSVDNSLQYKHGKLVRNFMSHCKLTAANFLSICTGPRITHFGPTGSSMLDYIMVPNALVEMINQISVLDEEGLNTSDHNPISMIILCDIPQIKGVKRKPTGHIKWDKIPLDVLPSKYTECLEPHLNRTRGGGEHLGYDFFQ